MLRKRITSAGNSAAIVLSQDLLGLMGVSIGDEVELQLVDRSLLVRPLTEGERQARVTAAMDRVFHEHDGLLRRLAHDETPTDPATTGRRQPAKPSRSPRRSRKRKGT